MNIDVVKLILYNCYPTNILNILLTCKRFAELLHDKVFYLNWYNTLYADLLENELIKPLNIKRELLYIKKDFEHVWRTIKYIEIYKPDSVYDIERIKCLTPVTLNNTLYLVTLSRFPSATSLVKIKVTFNPRIVGSSYYISQDKIAELLGSKGGSGIRYNLYNFSLVERAYNDIGKARQALQEKLICHNITSYSGCTYVHNVIIKQDLYDMQGNLVHTKDETFKTLLFEVGDFTKCKVLSTGLQVTFQRRNNVHTCNCIYCPLKNN